MSAPGDNEPPRVIKRPPPPVPSRTGLVKFGTPPKIPNLSNSADASILSNSIPGPLSPTSNNVSNLSIPPINQNNQSLEPLSPTSVEQIQHEEHQEETDDKLQQQKTVNALTISSLKIAMNEGSDNQVNWENFENLFKKAQDEEKELHDLFDYSPYDIEVLSVPRKDISNEQIASLEESLNDPRLPSFSKECINFFLSPYIQVKGSYFDQSLDTSTANSQRRNRRTKILNTRDSGVLNRKIESTLSSSTEKTRAERATTIGPANSTGTAINLEAILSKRLQLVKHDEGSNNNSNNNNSPVQTKVGPNVPPKNLSSGNVSNHPNAPKPLNSVGTPPKFNPNSVQPPPRRVGPPVKAPPKIPGQQEPVAVVPPKLSPTVPVVSTVSEKKEVKNENLVIPDIDLSLLDCNQEERMAIIRRSVAENTPKDLFLSVDPEKEVQSNLSTPPFYYKTSKRLKIEFKELSLPVDELFFCALSLHDIKTKARVSELFYFDLTSENHQPSKSKNAITSSRQCFIPIHYDNITDLVLIIRIQKLFKGDIEKDILLYMKSKSSKKGQVEKLKVENQEIPPDFGIVLQPFLWVPVFIADERGKVRTGDVAIDEFRPIRTLCGDEYIYEQLSKELEGKKGKMITGNLVLTISNESEDKVQGLVSPSYVSVNPQKNAQKVTREIQWMGQTQCPDLTYVNNLYIMPHSVNLKQHQNIQISVEFKCDENEPPLASIYGTYGSDNFVASSKTAVTYKEKKPQFFDEFKIKLPCVMNAKHHLLFTFHNLGVTKELIGYAIFPLFSPTKGIAKSDKYTIHLFQELVPNYLELLQSDGLKWLLGKQSTFTFFSKLLSSIYPEDDRIIQLSTLMDNGKDFNDNSYLEALVNLQKIPPNICMKHFPPMLNIIFRFLCSGNDVIGKEAMGCLSKILKGVKTYSNEKSPHNSFLLSYARYVFDNPPSVPAYEPISKYWLQFIEEKNPNFQDLGQTWVLLDIIIKSMMLKLCENGKPEPSARLTAFSKEFLDNLKKLVNALFCVPIGNMDILTLVPLFMKDLLVVMNRGLVFEMIFKYISWLNNENHTGDIFLATVKFTFIKIITDYKNYIPLNIPTEIKLNEDSSSTVQNFWFNHFFSGMLIREVRAGLLQKQRIREQSISTLSSLLHSHDMDMRYSDPLRKQRIAGLYFPFVITAVEFHQVLEDYLVEEEKMNWLLCFFYIVKNCSRGLIRQWWTNETDVRKEKFFAMMEMGITIFKGHELFNPMCFIILDLLLEFLILFKDLLNRQDNSVLTRIFNIIQKLQENKSNTFIVCMMNLIKVIIDTLSQPIYCHKSLSFCQSLAYDILQHLNSDQALIRSKACALFYYFLQKNYEEAKNVNRVQFQFTISISRLVAESKLQKNNNIQTSLKIIEEFAKTQNNLDFVLVEETIKQIKKLMLYSQQLQEYKDSPEMIAELYLKISDSNKDSPDVRITWLEELARVHSNNSNWCESALVRVRVAAMIAQYLNVTSYSPIDIRSFSNIIPNCDLEMISPEMAKTLDGTSVNWSVEGFIRVVERAILLMKQAKQYELCIELYTMLVLAYKSTSNHAKLIDCLTEFKLLTEVLIQTNKDLRLIATYFRVAFYGTLFGSEEGKQYVYKCAAKENLMTIQQYFKSTLTKTFNKTEEEIEVLGNADVDKSKLEPNKLYLQVAMVLPYIEPSEEETRDTPFAKNFNLKSFLFESAFNDGNQQSKKKTIFHVSMPFPNLLCRSEVINTTEIILSPLESAIDLIKDRIVRFDLELNVMFKDVRVNQLQQLLQGSVVPMVNEGPLKICETFLSKEERGKYPKAQIKELESLMIKFVKMCGFGVKLSGQVIEARELTEYQQFQNMIEVHYRGMKEKTSVYFNID